MIDAQAVISAIGRAEIAEALDIKIGTVSAAYVSNKIPAPWFPTIKRLAREKGISVPAGLFSWRMPEDASSAELDSENT